ncbi:MAG: DUF2461 domain-containing protein [Crocinitomicaceae bacterium]|nr:DUF2461 domain-containing protein [Crocinitomicaceae bacterium]
MPQIKASNFKFLKDLQKNNNRDWFTENKKRYTGEHEEIIEFADALLAKMNEHDAIETPTGKKSLYRIYRDVRFSKDKSPYKTHWSGGFKRATAARRGGYYFHIQPGGQSFIGGGFWGPNKDDLQRIREEIATDATEMREIITDPTFVSTFGSLDGDQLKTAPKGFDKEHPNVDLLRYKQFIFGRNFADKEVQSTDFLELANSTFKAMRPFFDYMSDILTTDSNGESII